MIFYYFYCCDHSSCFAKLMTSFITGRTLVTLEGQHLLNYFGLGLMFNKQYNTSFDGKVFHISLSNFELVPPEI